MSLKDTFRSLRRGGEDSAGPDSATDSPAELGTFTPRSDGVYDGGEDPDVPGSQIVLRFSGNRVREVTTADLDAARAALPTSPLVGDYTPSGRFSVQGDFRRPIVYTVLADIQDGYTARRTNSGTATTHEVTLTFAPDA